MTQLPERVTVRPPADAGANAITARTSCCPCSRLRRCARAAERKSMALSVASLSLEVIAALRPLVRRIKRHDRSLADQLVRAASSVALNIGEAERSDPGNRKARVFAAAGSANETLMALSVALAWGYFPKKEAEEAEALLRRVIALLWKLTRG
jgi:four helix bundle protein